MARLCRALVCDVAIGEVGQAIGPDYFWEEAILGTVSEAIYFPASGFTVSWMLQRQQAGSARGAHGG